MRIEQLAYFIETAKYGSLNKAAEKLYITQPALGAAIKKLENELGYPLFIRESYGLKLTQWGRQTLQIAGEIMRHYDDLNVIKYAYKQSTAPEKVEGKLNVSAIRTLSLNALPDVVFTLAGLYPKIDITVIEQNTAAAMQSMITGESDVALFNLEAEDEQSFQKLSENGRKVIPLWDEKLFAIISSSSDLMHYQSLSLAKLDGKPLAINAFFFDDYEQLAFTQKFLPHCRIAFRSNNFELVQQYVSASDAFSFAFIGYTKDLEKTFLEKIAIKPIKENLTMRFYAVYDENNPRLKQIEIFIKILCDLYDLKDR